LENNMLDILVNMTLIIHWEQHFMHDGAPSHFSLVARRYLVSEYSLYLPHLNPYMVQNWKSYWKDPTIYWHTFIQSNITVVVKRF
jgi:hypothetical protein